MNEIIKEVDEKDKKDSAQQMMRNEIKRDVAEAVDEILEEARIETSKKLVDDTSVVASFRPEKQTSRSGPPPPSVPPPPPPLPASIEPTKDDNNFEANFEVNFDDAFGEPTPELPKQLGGKL